MKTRSLVPPYSSTRLVLVFLLLPVSMAVGQSAATEAFDAYDLGSRERAIIAEVFESAASQDIPADFLLPRLQEGLAKNIPAQRIAAALAAEVDSYATARSLLRSVPGGAKLAADRSAWARTAILLRVPLSGAEIESLADAATGDPAAYRGGTALYVSLTEWGLEKDTSLSVSAAAMKSDLPESDYSGILDLLARGRQSRVSLDRLVERILIVLPETSRLRSLERAVLP